MKRSLIQRQTPLERGEPLKARRWGVKPAPRRPSWRDEYMPERRAPGAAKYTAFELSWFAFVRTLPCCASHLGSCRGAIQAAHMTLSANEKGMGAKVPHTQTVPLCAKHHAAFDQLLGDFSGLLKDERYALAREWVEATRLLAIPEDRAQADDFEEIGIGRVVPHGGDSWSWMPGDAVERAA